MRGGKLSYQVIARKWRPKGFSEIVGQSHISQTLVNALRSNRLPHALLFTGPRGTGKTSSARILAKALRCPNAKDFVPCNECSDCMDISNGRSVDVIEIDGASNNGVDAIRELRDTVSYMPSSGFHKVYIIDEVHMLSTSAFNALLKTLEEPPEHVIFVMATTEAHKIPNTILSRCQRFDFRRISLKLVCDHLRSICDSEGVDVDEEALWSIARQGDGSMRDSQSLLDQVITFSDKHITLQKVVDVLGLTDRSLLTKTVAALIHRDTDQILEIIENIFTAGFDPKVFAQDLLEELRHLLIVKLANKPNQQIIDLPESEILHLQELSKDLSEEDIHLLFDMALKGANEIPKAQDTRIVLEMLLLRMSSAPRIMDITKAFQNGSVVAAISPTQTPRSMPATRQQVEAKVSQPVANPAPARVTSESPAPQKPKTPASSPQNNNVAATSQPPATAAPTRNTSGLNDTQARWLELIDRIRKVNPMMATQLEHTYIVDIKDCDITLGVPAKMKFLASQIRNADFIKKLTNYVNTFWGGSNNIVVKESMAEKKSPQFTPKQLEKQQNDAKKREVRSMIENHPLVKEVNTHFKTEIQSIKELS